MRRSTERKTDVRNMVSTTEAEYSWFISDAPGSDGDRRLG